MNSYSNYSVTIKNSSSHTWLVFETGQNLSINPPCFSCAVTCNCEAIFEATEDVNARRHEDEKKFFITKAQYERMILRIEELKASRVTYALIPVKDHEYNCVKACRVVLNAGEIDFLDDVLAPLSVRSKIRGDPPDIYMSLDQNLRVAGFMPRLWADITQAFGFDLNNGYGGWIFGGGLLGGLVLMLILSQRNRN